LTPRVFYLQANESFTPPYKSHIFNFEVKSAIFENQRGDDDESNKKNQKPTTKTD
jgi:hypothetical protein